MSLDSLTAVTLFVLGWIRDALTFKLRRRAARADEARPTADKFASDTAAMWRLRHGLAYDSLTVEPFLTASSQPRLTGIGSVDRAEETAALARAEASARIIEAQPVGAKLRDEITDGASRLARVSRRLGRRASQLAEATMTYRAGHASEDDAAYDRALARFERAARWSLR